MDPFSLIQAGGALVGNVVSNVFNARAQSQANKMNYKIMQEQNSFNERMWHLNNAYNTPDEQKKRLVAAGINPSLALANIGTGTAQGAVQASPSATMQAPQISNVGDSIGNVMASIRQNQLIDAQVEKTKAETRSIDSLTGNTLQDSSVYRGLTKVDIDTANFKLSQLKDFNFLQKKYLSESVNSIVAGRNLNESMIDLNIERLHLIPFEKKKLQAETKNVLASAMYLSANGKLAEANIALVAQEVLLKRATEGSIKFATKRSKAMFIDELKHIRSGTRSNNASALFNETKAGNQSFENAVTGVNSIANIIQRNMEIGIKAIDALVPF